MLKIYLTLNKYYIILNSDEIIINILKQFYDVVKKMSPDYFILPETDKVLNKYNL